MTEATSAPAGGEGAPAPAPAIAPANDAPLTASEAAAALSQRRWEKHRQSQAPEAAEAAPVETPQELPAEAIAAPETDPGETADQGSEPEANELPPIEPPRSWTKEEKAEFATYPREAQEKIARREQERERAIRSSQNEAAEIRKAAEAERAKVEQARQQYEQALPALMETLQSQQAGQFADIRTQADVQRMATEDPLRYIQWNAHREQVSAIQNEMRQAQERQSQEWNQKWQDFATKEDAKTSEMIPELSDPKQRAKVQEAALTYLKDKGFTESELGSAWNGQASLSLRDHRIQGLIRDAVKYREGQEAAKAKLATPKPLPTVQRPGVSAPKVDNQVVALTKKLEQTGDMRDAAALVAARRAASR
jgi:hypothetical protein